MIRNRFFFRNVVSGLSVLLTGCVGSSANILKVDEARLETGGDLAQYHYLVKEPYSVGLSHEGYIVGIEKSPRANIGNGFDKSLDTGRFRMWKTDDHPTNDKAHTEARNAHIDRVTDDGKSMFVSHVLAYDLDTSRGARFAVSPLYLGYGKSGFAPNGRMAAQSATKKGGTEVVSPDDYERGWTALGTLGAHLKEKLKRAGADGQDYTHIIVTAMGWNNNQVETVRRYNALMGNITARADQIGVDAKAFKPLLIGLTWPSVWGGESYFNFINTIAHLISYPNKADDADEIGYTIANILINKILQELKSEYDLKIVLVGHSMGARMMSRAMYSAHLINTGSKSYEGAADLFLGLQGAFSVRRFNKDFRLPFPMRLFRKGEGSPYLLKSGNPGRVVLTWAKDDKANPAARWVTGAAHAGAEAGYKESKKIRGKFYQLKWDGQTDGADGKEAEIPEFMSCADLSEIDMNRIVMVNADKIVNDHNDILDPEMGRLIWDSISCLTMERSKSSSGFVDIEGRN